MHDDSVDLKLAARQLVVDGGVQECQQGAAPTRGDAAAASAAREPVVSALGRARTRARGCVYRDDGPPEYATRTVSSMSATWALPKAARNLCATAAVKHGLSRATQRHARVEPASTRAAVLAPEGGPTHRQYACRTATTAPSVLQRTHTLPTARSA